jgi:hypothetical protein
MFGFRHSANMCAQLSSGLTFVKADPEPHSGRDRAGTPPRLDRTRSGIQAKVPHSELFRLYRVTVPGVRRLGVETALQRKFASV